MKKLFFTLAFIVTTVTYSFGQGNLQFNQVVNGDLNAYATYDLSTLGTITVPAGKVWKIESVSLKYFDGAWAASDGNPVFINNHLVWDLGPQGLDQLPLWLSAGTYTVQTTGYNSSELTFSYSAIEFNVVP